MRPPTTSSVGALALAFQTNKPRRGRTTVVEDVGVWVSKLRYEDLTPQAIQKAKRVLLDTPGCALGALDAAPVRMAQQVVALQGGNPQATVIGLGSKVSCEQAAFLNGTSCRRALQKGNSAGGSFTLGARPGSLRSEDGSAASKRECPQRRTRGSAGQFGESGG